MTREIAPDRLRTLLADDAVADPWIGRFDTSASWILNRRDRRDIDRIMLVEPRGGGDPVGYYLVRVRANEKRPIRERYFGVRSMTLMHYGVLDASDTALEQILAAALDQFWATEADLFEIVTSQPAMRAAAKRAGMIPLGPGMSFKFMEPGALKGTLPTRAEDYKLTHYAGDAFGFE